MKFKNFKEFLSSKGVEDISTQNAEDLAGLYNEFNEAKRKELEEAIEGKASKEDIDTMRSELIANQNDQMKALNDVLKKQGLAIQRIAAGDKADANKTFSEQLKEQLLSKIDNLTAMKEGNREKAKANQFSFNVKVAGAMTLGGNVSGGNIPVEDRLQGFNIVPSRRIRLLDVMSSRRTSSNVVSWVYQANKDGAAGQTAEAAAKNQIDFDLVVDSQSTKKTTAYIKVSTEMMDDITWVQSEIQQELMRELLKKVEETTYSGDNSGQNHNGVRTTASAFAAGAFAGAIDNANEVDVLVVAVNQIKVAQEMGATPNYIFMHPTDVTRMKLEKLSSTDKRYVERLMQVGSTLLMDGIPIIETTLVDIDEYLIGDFRKAISVSRSEVMIDIGLDGNDFTENLRTILAEWRGLTIVKQNDRSAFVAGDFTTDKAALETA